MQAQVIAPDIWTFRTFADICPECPLGLPAGHLDIPDTPPLGVSKCPDVRDVRPIGREISSSRKRLHGWRGFRPAAQPTQQPRQARARCGRPRPGRTRSQKTETRRSGK